MNIVKIFNKSKLVHFVIDKMEFRKIINYFLNFFPLKKKISESNTYYRCRFIESISLADEFFNQTTYSFLKTKNILTFLDLGCNTGLFVAYLHHITNSNNIEGLAIDANPDMIKETKWVLKKNNLCKVFPILGLVGSTNSESVSKFYLSSSNLLSSQYPIEDDTLNQNGSWTKIMVSNINIDELWKNKFGNKRCNLLKIDIEGSEKDFLNESIFLEKVDLILIEWHGWAISKEKVNFILNKYGFVNTKTLENIKTRGVDFYERISN